MCWSRYFALGNLAAMEYSHRWLTFLRSPTRWRAPHSAAKLRFSCGHGRRNGDSVEHILGSFDHRHIAR